MYVSVGLSVYVTFYVSLFIHCNFPALSAAILINWLIWSESVFCIRCKPGSKPLSMKEHRCDKQESRAIADKPTRRESLPKLLQFDVPTTLSLTILAYLYDAFNCYCVRNPEKFTENSNLWSSTSSKIIDIGVNRKPVCDLLLVISSNFSRIGYRFWDIHG